MHETRRERSPGTWLGGAGGEPGNLGERRGRAGGEGLRAGPGGGSRASSVEPGRGRWASARSAAAGDPPRDPETLGAGSLPPSPTVPRRALIDPHSSRQGRALRGSPAAGAFGQREVGVSVSGASPVPVFSKTSC